MIKLLIKNSTSFTGSRRSLLLPQGLQPGLSPRSRDLLDKEQLFYLHLTHQKLMINYIFRLSFKGDLHSEDHKL